MRNHALGPETAGEAALARRLAAALVLSLLVLAAGMAWTWRIGRDSGSLYHELAHVQESLEGLKQAGRAAP